MKRLLLFALFAMICVYVHADWIQCSENSTQYISINDRIFINESGNYVVYVMYVTKPQFLASKRSQMYYDYKDPAYLSLTHEMLELHVDLSHNRMKNYAAAYFASDYLIESVVMDGVWYSPAPNSVAETLIKMVKLIIEKH